MTKRRYKAQDFIDAIPTSGGIVSTIAERVGCDWHTVKAWLDKSSTVRTAYDAECEAVSDMAENVLFQRIKEGDEATAKWWLSRIRRGKFAERTELTGAEDEPLHVVIRYARNPDNPTGAA